MKCLVCGKKSINRLCSKCKAEFPADFSIDRPAAEVVTEYKRNARLKKNFSPDKKLGILEIDMLDGMFHIGNIYRSVTELKEYTFHTTTPHFDGVIWRRDVSVDIFFTYRLRNGIKNTVRIDTAICPYRNDGRYVTVEPPLKLFGYKQQFAELMQTTGERLRKAIAESDKLLDDEYI